MHYCDYYKNSSEKSLKTSCLNILKSVIYRTLVYGLVVNHIVLSTVQAIGGTLFVDVSAHADRPASYKIWTESDDLQVQGLLTGDVDAWQPLNIQNNDYHLSINQTGEIQVHRLNSSERFNLTSTSIISFLAGSTQCQDLTLSADQLYNYSALSVTGDLKGYVKTKFHNKSDAEIVSSGAQEWSFDWEAINDGIIQTQHTFTLSNGGLRNHQYAHIFSTGDMNIKQSAVILNEAGGNVYVGGNFFHNAKDCLSQNLGQWTFNRAFYPDTAEVTLTGTTLFLSQDLIARDVPDRDNALKIENMGQCYLSSLGVQSGRALYFYNYGNLIAVGDLRQPFASLHNIKTMRMSTGDWALIPIPRGLVLTTSSTSDQVYDQDEGTFVNTGDIQVEGNLDYGLSYPLGKIKLDGDLDYLSNYKRMLTEMVQVTCAGRVSATLASQTLDHNLDLVTINALTLTATEPLQILAKLLTQELELDSSTEVLIDAGNNSIGEIETSRGPLALKAYPLNAPKARLKSANSLKLKGNLNIGGFEEKAPISDRFLGAWAGQAVDKDLNPIENNRYRANNGAYLSAKTKLLLKGDINLKYLQLLSGELTKLITPHPLQLTSVDFIGSGGLRFVSPYVDLNFAGTGKGKRYDSGTIIYDYLLSSPCQINHLGRVFSLADKIDFHGTPITAEEMIIRPYSQGHQNNSQIRFLPIALASVDEKAQYGMKHKREKGRKSTETINFMVGHSILTRQYEIKQKGFFDSFVSNILYGDYKASIPTIDNPSVAEIDAFCRYLFDINVGKSISQAVTGDTLLKYWLSPSITPTLTIGKSINLDASTIQGQTTISTHEILLKTTGDLDGYNNTPRQEDSKPTAREIDLASSAHQFNLDTQNLWFSDGVIDANDLAVTVASITHDSYPIGHTIQAESWPQLEYVLQATLSTWAGKNSIDGYSGSALINKIIYDSKIFSQAYKQGGVLARFAPYYDLHYNDAILLYHQLSAVDSTGPARLMLHIPPGLQNPYTQAGDWVVDKIDATVGRSGSLDDYRIFLKNQAYIHGINLELATTAQPQRTATSLSLRPHAPGEIYLNPYAQLFFKADKKMQLKGEKLSIDYGGKVGLSGEDVDLVPTQLRDEYYKPRHHETIIHHHPTTVSGLGYYSQTARNFHTINGATIAAANNHFIRGNVIARAIGDYKQETTKEKHRRGLTSKRKYTSSQTPISVLQPTFDNQVIFDNETYKGEGAILKGNIIDNTKVMELRPAILESFFTMVTKKNWGGITKGLNHKQGSEHLIESRIDGSFISNHHPEATAAENILKLTNVIMGDESLTEIAKTVFHDTYTPKEWSKTKQTGNFKTVALVTSLVVSISTAYFGTGGWLMNAVEKGLEHAVYTAGFSSLCAQASSSLVINQGNLSKVGHELLTTKTLKNVALAAGTAGILHQLGTIEGFSFLKSPTGVSQHVMRQLVDTTVRINLDFALNGGSYLDRYPESAKTAVIQGVANWLCSCVGERMGKGEIDRISHKVFHAAIGAAASATLHEDIVAGGLGALIGETIAETVYLEKAKDLDPSAVDYKDKEKNIKDQTRDLGRYAAIAAAVIAKCDPEEALAAADRALVWDFSQSIEQLAFQYRKESFIDPHVPAVDWVKRIPGNNIEEQVRYALTMSGVSSYEIETILSDSSIKNTLEKSEAFKDKLPFCGDTWMSGKQVLKCRVIPYGEKLSLLENGLTILKDGATGFYSLATAYPNLTNACMITMQVALSGPAGYFRSIVYERTGIQDQFDSFTEKSEAWVSHQLQSVLNMDAGKAEFLSSAGGFGLTAGLSAIGGANKDKVLHKAEETVEKVKVYVTYYKHHVKTDVKPYTGRASGWAKGVDDMEGIENILKKRDKNHHMNKKGYKPPKLDKASLKPEAIRGQEQFNIDKLGGAQSKGGTSSNFKNGIADKNPNKSLYEAAREQEFGQ